VIPATFGCADSGDGLTEPTPVTPNVWTAAQYERRYQSKEITMTIKRHHQTVCSTLAVGAATLLTACGAGTAAVSSSQTEDATVVSAELYCVVRELPDDGKTQQIFEEFCIYEGNQPNPYPHGILRERVEEDDVFTSTGNDGSARTGTCLGEWLEEYPRASERDAGVLPFTPGALQGHQLCTFSGSFVGDGERAGQHLLEEGSMYRASKTTFRGLVTVRPAP
jgi:hypothetical protein